jgi:hypothetical protein
MEPVDEEKICRLHVWATSDGGITIDGDQLVFVVE